MTEPLECKHETVEYDPGNYVPPFGWEQHPGMFCLDCGQQMEDDEVDYPGAPGPDWEDPS